MTYPDGSEVLVGDTILFEGGRTSGTVVAVIADELAEFNVDEPGVMVRSAPLELVFIPASLLASDRVSLEQRGKSNYRWSGP